MILYSVPERHNTCFSRTCVDVKLLNRRAGLMDHKEWDVRPSCAAAGAVSLSSFRCLDLLSKSQFSLRSGDMYMSNYESSQEPGDVARTR